jgi:hypothetical protein
VGATAVAVVVLLVATLAVITDAPSADGTDGARRAADTARGPGPDGSTATTTATDGDHDGDAATVPVDAPAPTPVGVDAEQITERDDGTRTVTGDVELELDGGTVALDDADLELAPGPDGSVEVLGGTARVPFPTAGVTAHAEPIRLPTGTVGVARGRDLGHLAPVLRPDVEYLYVSFDDGLEVDLGFDRLVPDLAGVLPRSITVPSGVPGTVVVDPADPFVWVSRPCPDATDGCGIGISAGGHLAYAPEAADAPAAARPFSGHVTVVGAVPLPKQTSLVGEAVWRITDRSVTIGGNGDVVFGVPELGFSDGVDVRLGQASVGSHHAVTEAGLEDTRWVAGSQGGEEVALPLGVTVPTAGGREARWHGQLTSTVSATGTPGVDPDSYLEVAGRVDLGRSVLADLAGIDLSDVLVQEARLRADRTGLRVTGSVTGDLHRWLRAGGGVTADAHLAIADPGASYLELRGDLAVGGTALGADAHARLDASGVRASGTFATPVSRIAVAGAITAEGFRLEGDAEVVLPLADLQAAARAGIGDARAEVERLDAEIAARRDQVRREREAGHRGLADARSAVAAAERELSAIQSNIDANDRRISELRRKQRDAMIDNPLWELEIQALNVANGTQYAAREIAEAALGEAQRILAGIQDAIHAVPIDADPRVAALIAARETASLALDAADGLVGLAELDGRLAAAVHVELGPDGLAGSASASWCDPAGGCVELGGSVRSAPPQVCVLVADTDVCTPL